MCSKIAFLSVLSGILLLATVVEARDYTRSCAATYRFTNAWANMVTVDWGHFSARHTRGRYVPNSIRVAAHQKAVRCIRAGWEARYENTPDECTEDYGVHGYPAGLIAYPIGRAVCRAWGRLPGESVHVNVYAYVRGDKGCGGNRRSTNNPWVPIAYDQELTCR